MKQTMNTNDKKNQPANKYRFEFVDFNSRNLTGVIIFNLILNFQTTIITIACVINGIFDSAVEVVELYVHSHN